MDVNLKTMKTVLERCSDVGNLPFYIETCHDGVRVEQAAFDVLLGKDKILIVSKEAMDAGDLSFLPEVEKH